MMPIQKPAAKQLTTIESLVEENKKIGAITEKVAEAPEKIKQEEAIPPKVKQEEAVAPCVELNDVVAPKLQMAPPPIRPAHKNPEPNKKVEEIQRRNVSRFTRP